MTIDERNTVTATTPVPQHLAALANAQRIRLARSDLKQEIHDNPDRLEQFIASPPDDLQGATVFSLLMAQHRWGRKKSLALLREVAMSESKLLCDISERQRERLLVLLERRRSERRAA